MSCGKRFAPSQRWAFCGQKDPLMKEPALCTRCGGPFRLAEDNLTKEEREALFVLWWDLMKKRGYNYGEDALDNVKVGFMGAFDVTELLLASKEKLVK